MEVCTLAWLSGDEYLISLVNGEEDFYRSLFKLISGAECDTDEKRNFCKKIFLPVFYGESAKELANNLNFSVETAYKVVGKLKTLFPRVFSWADEYPYKDECVDYYGRKRKFSLENRYKYRNFIIQSPAAIICLDRLVRLYHNLGSYGKLAAHIHDGYIIKVDDKYIEIVKSLCIDSLQSESQICPGLNLKTNFKIGKTLA
jgi:DNA polymerase I-like protein with 3'-5' exonuclease and polymerase domains